jgi:hypothetical protein
MAALCSRLAVPVFPPISSPNKPSLDHAERPPGAARPPGRQEQRQDAEAAQVGLQARGLAPGGGIRGRRGLAQPPRLRLVVVGGQQRPPAVLEEG